MDKSLRNSGKHQITRSALRISLNYPDWRRLPNLSIEKILSYLSCADRAAASLACRSWRRTYERPSLWSTLHLTLWDDDARSRTCDVRAVARFGRYVRSLWLLITGKRSVHAAVRILYLLNTMTNRNFSGVRVRAPLTSKHDFLPSLLGLLAPQPGKQSGPPTTLTMLDLFIRPLDMRTLCSFLLLIGGRNPMLKSVSISGPSFLNLHKVTSKHRELLIEFKRLCCQLTDLNVFIPLPLLDHQLMQVFLEPNQQPLHHLSITSHNAYCPDYIPPPCDLTREDWINLQRREPNFRLSVLIVCTAQSPRRLLGSVGLLDGGRNMPVVRSVVLVTYHCKNAYVVDGVRLISRLFGRSVRELTLNVVNGPRSKQLEAALRRLSRRCSALTKVSVNGVVLRPEIAREITAHHPKLKMEIGEEFIHWVEK